MSVRSEGPSGKGCNIIFDNEITLPARLRLCFVNLLFESELDMITLRIKLGSSSRFGF